MTQPIFIGKKHRIKRDISFRTMQEERATSDDYRGLERDKIIEISGDHGSGTPSYNIIVDQESKTCTDLMNECRMMKERTGFT